MNIEIKRVEVGLTKENCYLINCGKEAYIVDPGDDYLYIIDEFKLESYNLKAIINTHGHYDHIGAIVDLKNRYNIPFLMHSADKKIVSRGNLYKRMANDFGEFKTPNIDGYLDNITSLEIYNKQINIFHIPGHTPGCICFEFSNSLIIGDVILENSTGRTDLPGGNQEQMNNSLRFISDRFKNYTIYPGHGAPFILNNEFLNKLNLKE